VLFIVIFIDNIKYLNLDIKSEFHITFKKGRLFRYN